MNLRLFAALDLPVSVLGYLSAIMTQLRADLPRNAVRWVRPEGIHLTVRFYGETKPEQIKALQDSLAQATTGLGPIELKLNGLGIFPNTVAPRVIWAGVAGQVDAVQRIQTALETGARAIGFRPETRPFTPHLTLGRVNQLRAPDKQRLSQLVNEAPLNAPNPFTLDRVSLIKSELKPTGAVYTQLWSALLTGQHSSAF